jgi:hypothetical protein
MFAVNNTFTRARPSFARETQTILREVVICWRETQTISLGMVICWREMQTISLGMVICWREMQTISLEMVTCWRGTQTISLEMVICWRGTQTISLEMVTYWREMQTISPPAVTCWMETEAIAEEMALECEAMKAALASARLVPATVFAALSHPVRWRLIVMMADGRKLSASQAAAAVGRPLDGVIKHLHTLRDSGLVQSKYKEDDRRSQLFYIPEVWRTEPEVLDFGFCILDRSATQR